jgi:hypothetical protein
MCMKMPVWIAPAAVGAVFGAIAISVLGFNWGGLILNHNALEMAETEAQVQVVDELLPICLEQAKMDPNAAEQLAKLKVARSHERQAAMVETGWATMPGTTDTNRFLVSACLEKLSPVI